MSKLGKPEFVGTLLMPKLFLIKTRKLRLLSLLKLFKILSLLSIEPESYLGNSRANEPKPKISQTHLHFQPLLAICSKKASAAAPKMQNFGKKFLTLKTSKTF